MEKSKLFRVGDIFAVLFVLLLAAGVFFAGTVRKTGNTAVVRVNGEVVAELPLAKDAEKTFSANGHTLTVRVKDGAVCVLDADCPDRVCERTGEIRRAGALIVCAPAGISVSVSGEEDADAYVG